MDEKDQAKVTALIKASEVEGVVNSYFRALDEKDFAVERFAAIFTSDAKVTRPNGVSIMGPEEIRTSHQRSFARFEGTQHILTGHDISIMGSKAVVRVNLVAMHMWQGSKTDASCADNFFLAGGVVNAELLESEGQWKISLASNEVVWRAGAFKSMLETK